MNKASFNLSNPDYFYKYLSSERSDFFKHCSLRFSPRESLNDPFEQSMAERAEIENLSEDDRRAFYATIGNIYSHSPSLLSMLIEKKTIEEQSIKRKKITKYITDAGWYFVFFRNSRQLTHVEPLRIRAPRHRH